MTDYIYKMYLEIIFDIYVKTGFGINNQQLSFCVAETCKIINILAYKFNKEYVELYYDCGEKMYRQ